jgi:hypothetical protein
VSILDRRKWSYDAQEEVLMNRISLASALVLCGTLLAVPAEAIPRSFVSAETGSDSNPCSRALPCRSFAAAITITDPGGEIDTLDPGGYGAVTITKAISIISGLGEAGVLVPPGGTGIDITAGATDKVNLRGLFVEGAASGLTGIAFQSGGSLTITNCVIRNVVNDGIDFIPSVTATMNLAIADTLSADNGFGLVVSPTAVVTANIVLDRVLLLHNSMDGMLADGALGFGTIKLTATECVSANNARDGIFGFTVNSHASVNLMLTRCTVANNTSTGLDAQGGGPVTIRFGASVITGNATTWHASSGSILTSYGDNYIDGNSDGDPAPPVISRK